MDISRQVAYWLQGAKDDFESAEILFHRGKLRQALFFTHLALEKILKAHVTRATADVPPRIHNLIRLAELSGLSIPQERILFLRGHQAYALEGRYPDASRYSITEEIALQEIQAAREMMEWLIAQFSA